MRKASGLVLFQQVVRKSFQENWGQGGVPSSLFQSVVLSVFPMCFKTLVWGHNILSRFPGPWEGLVMKLNIIKVVGAMLCVGWHVFSLSLCMILTTLHPRPEKEKRSGDTADINSLFVPSPFNYMVWLYRYSFRSSGDECGPAVAGSMTNKSVQIKKRNRLKKIFF